MLRRQELSAKEYNLLNYKYSGLKARYNDLLAGKCPEANSTDQTIDETNDTKKELIEPLLSMNS